VAPITSTIHGSVSEVLVGGAAYELDWRNFNAGSRADINVNGFLGRTSQPAASSGNYVEMTATVVAHELGRMDTRQGTYDVPVTSTSP
jgi:hypothetical protein